MLPSILAKQLQEGIGDYIETSFPMVNEPFKGSLHKFVKSYDSLYHEPYISVKLPFRVASVMPTCFQAIHPLYLPYVHQQKAFERLTGEDGKSTLIATGTGSGKTECFLYPILEYCYRHRGEKGIKALIIYPMNALATDQAKRIAELIDTSPELKGNVTAGMYVGGVDHVSSRLMGEHNIITDHETLLNNPPDILLTNYKMLDYLLVRPKDATLWRDNSPESLKYIAVDELHTFDGAQGTDLACLLRRLKSRLHIPNGHLCCIGTSATMGLKENASHILEYATEVFGEPFEPDSVITEDRLKPVEFFANNPISDFTFPTKEQSLQLEKLVLNDDQNEYIKYAASIWLDLNGLDILTDKGRIELGNKLMNHCFLQNMISLMNGNFYQVEGIVDELKTKFPELSAINYEDAINALFALISFARTGHVGNLRPFMNVSVQLWVRELRRLVGKVSDKEVTYSIAHDLNEEQSKHYLPVINCRDCGATGWVTLLNDNQCATIGNLEAFYNKYFDCDDKVLMMFPGIKGGDSAGNLLKSKICPECLQFAFGENSSDTCDGCGTKMIDVLIPNPIEKSGSKDHKQFVCPHCNSHRGLSLIGVRSTTEISASISQVFSSRFNDDKKTLAFSDNVQDAAHKAGFFNARTYHFGLRGAIQRYLNETGSGQNLDVFSKGFIKYWRSKMIDEDFVSFFIAPNMTWMTAYQDMIKNRELPKNQYSPKLISDIENRLEYEILLEYGCTSKIGRTLEKSNCSVLYFDKNTVQTVAKNVYERVVNEIGTLPNTGVHNFKNMVIGYLNLMKQNGSFEDSALLEFCNNDCKNTWILSNDYLRWMPGQQSGRNTPRFLAVPNVSGKRNSNLDLYSDKKYCSWIRSCFDKQDFFQREDITGNISKIIISELCKSGIIKTVANTSDYSIYGIDKSNVFVSASVVQYKCNKCGTSFATAKENVELWEGAVCLRKECYGYIEKDDSAALNYYGKLFSTGDLVRVNAKDHTGLLERNDREQLEIDFKRKKEDCRNWDPNVLSCTPTLEMGIDIGDLSTVILCSMPPAQSQFVQRTGRAGRKDGNAFTLAIANSKPHDLYFYADPMDMISGNVTPPKIFLKASAVLERQFVAFCMDSWVKKGLPDNAIPRNISSILKKLDSRLQDMFPFNFLNYVKSNLTNLHNKFILMFPNMDEGTNEDLRKFAQGDSIGDSPMYLRILNSFESLKQQRNALAVNIKQIKDLISELKNKPKDSSYDEDIKELQSEEYALLAVLKELGSKDVFNFLSDEGLLPNYAFPEAGIILKAILLRKEDKDETKPALQEKKKFGKSVYEYNRSSSSAISEFAPNNTFYADGKKLVIDQVDLTSAKTEAWRLCPNCSHAELVIPGVHTACCPKCGSPSWADNGQKRNMLKVQMVYSTMQYTKTLIDDNSDSRANVFYCKQLLVDVDEDNDILCAYQMDNKDFNFGYEFAKKATLREINFGESDTLGEKIRVSGIEEVRKGFRVCKYCGKLQNNPKRAVHTYFCKAKKQNLLSANDYEDCLFLYREFNTEILRLLIPATTMDSSKMRTESFSAAFMLGMKEYFGNVDHLRATVSEVPIPEAEYRKQYLVIYDSVPGGTGYLKQLMNDKNSLITIFEKALAVLENCKCKEDPHKDGCYHCLYAYRQNQNMANVSRTTAIKLLKSILSGKDNVVEIEKLGNVKTNSLFDSELERQFVEALRQSRTEKRKVDVLQDMINGKEGYILKVNDSVWEVEPQVLLDSSNGVEVTCKPDFIIRPLGNTKRKSIAIFTDGFTYHKDIVADDTLKREAIRRSGRYRVWSFSWRDVQNKFQNQGPYFTETLKHNAMPSGAMFQLLVKNYGIENWNIEKASSFELLLWYLENPDAEDMFTKFASVYSMCLLEPKKMNEVSAYKSWYTQFGDVNDATSFTSDSFEGGKCFFGIWQPRLQNQHITIYAGVPTDKMSVKNYPVSVCTILDDKKETRTDKYEEEWNGFLQYLNVMQFSPNYVAVSTTGLENNGYLSLPSKVQKQNDNTAVQPENDEWASIEELLFGESKDFVKKLKAIGVPVPSEDNIGVDVTDNNGQVIGTIEIAWPDSKVGYLTEEQLTDKTKLEAEGWKIISATDELDVSIFGGK